MIQARAGAPIMPDQMEAPVAMADRGHDIQRVPDQQLDTVAGMIGRIGPRILGIAPLIRRKGEKARLCQRRHLGVPEMP